MTDFQIKMHFLLVSMRYVRDEAQGICSNLQGDSLDYEELEKQDYENDKWLCSAFKKWKHFSGSFRYPVPHVELSTHGAFLMTTNKWTGAYGKKRKELLEFLIEEIQKDE